MDFLVGVVGFGMTKDETEKRAVLATIARELERLQTLAAKIDEGFLVYLLAAAREEAEAAGKAAPRTGPELQS
jgi:hypothetical protein